MTGSTVGAPRGDALTADDVLSVVEQLATLGAGGEVASDAERIDQITALERLKRAASAAQARVSVSFDVSRRAQQERAGVPAQKVGRGVSDQVALARMESPHRGGRHLGLARSLVDELPNTLAALTRGDVSEWGATVVARETAVLTVEHRREADDRLGDVLARPGVSERQLGDTAKAIAYELDAHAAVRRSAKAESDRCVTIRPAPDTMTFLTAHLPVAAGVAVFATLDRAALAAAAAGDPRTRSQVMADTLVARITGAGAVSDVADPPTATTPVTVHLVMTDTSLLAGGNTPATVLGHGPVPSAVARRLVAEADAAWVRRLWTRPDDGELVSMDSRSRLFPAGLARLITLRDQVCATPWCDAPIRHIDHAIPFSSGGPTSYENGQGLCAHCNLVKEDAGFTTVRRGAATTVTTPTGHVYRGCAPPVPGLPPPRSAGDADTTPSSALERWMLRYLEAA